MMPMPDPLRAIVLSALAAMASLCVQPAIAQPAVPVPHTAPQPAPPSAQPGAAQAAAPQSATAQPAPARPLPSPAETRMPLPLANGSQIGAHWYPLPPQPDAAPRPAVVALHGCGGLWRSASDTGQRFEARYTEYIARLHAAGFHVLLPDSFSARGSGSICMQKDVERSIKVETRRADVAAAVAWLATQPTVDARRIVVLGWSHGGSTTLASIDAGRAGAAQPVAAAVVFYPGCGAFRRAPYTLRQPLLMLLGANDDWTPPAPCEQLTERLRREQGADVTLRVYADSYHGFDSSAPLRFRAGVPNGIQAGGVHQGGNPQARAAAFAELDAFLARVREVPTAAVLRAPQPN
jgi:dienelactone hydrolase